MDPSSAADAKPDPNARTKPSAGRWRLGLALLLLIAIVWAGYAYRDRLSPQAWVAQEAQLRGWIEARPWQAVGLSLVGYALVTGLSLPGAAVLSLLLGKLLGFGPGLLAVSFGSTLGAMMSFLLSRYLLREQLRSWLGSRITALDSAVSKEGASYLFSLRLLPVAPFWLVNLAMGLSSIRLFTFWWVSQLGMLPGTLAYVYAGSSLPDLQTLASGQISQIVSRKLLLGIAALAALPWLVKGIARLLKPGKQSSPPRE